MDKEHLAILRLREASQLSLAYYGVPLLLCDSGGKDSSALKQLAFNAKIPFEVLHNHTTADAPETVYFIRSEFARLENRSVRCTLGKPVYKNQRVTMWSLIPQKRMPPTWRVRYCCSILKEQGGANRFIATGVRWDESATRRNSRGIYEKSGATPTSRIILTNDNDERRRLFEHCRIHAKRVANPLIDWTDAEVWDYIAEQKIPCNPVYRRYGLRRCGCIGCPMAGRVGREKEFAIWPKFRQLYIQAFEKMLRARTECGLENRTWKSGLDVYHWWMEDGVLPGQRSLFADNLAEIDSEAGGNNP